MSCSAAHLRSCSLNIVSLSYRIEGSYRSWDLYTTGKLVDGLQKTKKKKKENRFSLNGNGIMLYFLGRQFYRSTLYLNPLTFLSLQQYTSSSNSIRRCLYINSCRFLYLSPLNSVYPQRLTILVSQPADIFSICSRRFLNFSPLMYPYNLLPIPVSQPADV